ncbi:MAG: Holliday junction branch migration protein RuvA [Christensenellales bacterium]|jgi:Holliday junction DNA helicase RuvA
MYEYIKGEVVEIGRDFAVIEAGGIGYYINTTAQSLLHIRTGEKCKLYCRFVVREDAHMLYGFYSAEEKEMFIHLTGVSGIGPKVALAVLSGLKVSDVASAIIMSDEKALCKIPGVGKKTAQRIIIDLAEKITAAETIDRSDTILPGAAGIETEAISALVSLGYNRSEAIRAVSSVKKLGDTAEDIILMALKRLGA